jgi:hypothetical protein
MNYENQINRKAESGNPPTLGGFGAIKAETGSWFVSRKKSRGL